MCHENSEDPSSLPIQLVQYHSFNTHNKTWPSMNASSKSDDAFRYHHLLSSTVGLKHNCKTVTKDRDRKALGTHETVTTATDHDFPYQLPPNHIQVLPILQPLAPLSYYRENLGHHQLLVRREHEAYIKKRRKKKYICG